MLINNSLSNNQQSTSRWKKTGKKGARGTWWPWPTCAQQHQKSISLVLQDILQDQMHSFSVEQFYSMFRDLQCCKECCSQLICLRARACIMMNVPPCPEKHQFMISCHEAWITHSVWLPALDSITIGNTPIYTQWNTYILSLNLLQSWHVAALVFLCICQYWHRNSL